MTDDWFAASVIEMSALIDELGDRGEVTLRPGDDAVAAILAALQASRIVWAAGQHAYRVAEILHDLEVV